MNQREERFWLLFQLELSEYLILLYFRGTLISRKFSRHISRIFNFAIGDKIVFAGN